MITFRTQTPVPALVSEEMFALAQEQFEKNKRHPPRCTVEPTLLQGVLVCEQCGYGLYRTSTHTIRVERDSTIAGRSEVGPGRDRSPSRSSAKRGPLHERQKELRREQMRIEKNSNRLNTAYREGMVTLSQPRQRMPALQKQAQAVGSELQSLEMAAVDEAKYLQLA